jgi:hypothetical protein
MWMDMEKEGEIYALQESKGVPNIAPFGKGNNVRHHATLTHTVRNEKWACWSRVMVLLSQYRMSLDVVARHFLQVLLYTKYRNRVQLPV